jgi:hypothetical protein
MGHWCRTTNHQPYRPGGGAVKGIPDCFGLAPIVRAP